MLSLPYLRLSFLPFPLSFFLLFLPSPSHSLLSFCSHSLIRDVWELCDNARTPKHPGASWSTGANSVIQAEEAQKQKRNAGIWSLFYLNIKTPGLTLLLYFQIVIIIQSKTSWHQARSTFQKHVYINFTASWKSWGGCVCAWINIQHTAPCCYKLMVKFIT